MKLSLSAPISQSVTQKLIIMSVFVVSIIFILIYFSIFVLANMAAHQGGGFPRFHLPEFFLVGIVLLWFNIRFFRKTTGKFRYVLVFSGFFVSLISIIIFVQILFPD